MITININNAKSKITCSLVELKYLRDNLKIRVPGAFFSQAFRNRTWDGFKYYITESGYTYTGMVPKILGLLKAKNWEYELIDNRISFSYNRVPKKVGNLELRGYQGDSVKSVVGNSIEDLYFPRGILSEATNAGKNLIAAGIFKSYTDDKKLIFLVNRQHIYQQAIEEIGKLIGDEVGYIGPNGISWNRFMVCMAQTLNNNLPKIKSQLSKFDICIVDECHYASSATYKYILANIENCYVRVGMSGTAFKHKDKNKNEAILSFFGPTLHTTSNDELIKLGFSSRPVVTITWGNTKVKIPGDYKLEETKGLIKSKERNGNVLKRVKKHVTKGRVPILIICKYHNHTELMYKKVVKKFPGLKVDFIHVKVKDRLTRLAKFKAGDTDILVSSKLIKEGQNLPLIRALTIAAGGDSVIDILQITGRALRKHKSKKSVFIDDFRDIGSYLSRHSKHRIKVYKDENFKVIDRTSKR